MTLPGQKPSDGVRRLLGLVAWLALAIGAVAAPASREYDLKAVFLLRFASFVEWPEGSAVDGQAPFVIGVLGDDPFGEVLDQVVAGEQVRGRNMAVRRCRNLEEAGRCQILFIANSESGRLARQLAELRGRSVLTVGEGERFVEAGGMIAFVRDSRLQLLVNLAAVRDAKLAVSSKLLRVAQVRGESPP